MIAQQVHIFSHDGQRSASDSIAPEISLTLEVIFGPKTNRTLHQLATTMCSPGSESELALGLLYSLSIIDGINDVDDMSFCLQTRLQSGREKVRVSLAPHKAFSPLDHSFGYPRFSSCGVCGNYEVPVAPKVDRDQVMVAPGLIFTMEASLRAHQPIFKKTGGTHAAALFTTQGKLERIFEDIGRHNALDKLVGSFLLEKMVSLHERILLMTSRASFEIIQKAARAGISMVVVMGAVSSMAIQAAQDSQIALIGFLRDQRFSTYTHPERIQGGTHD